MAANIVVSLGNVNLATPEVPTGDVYSRGELTLDCTVCGEDDGEAIKALPVLAVAEAVPRLAVEEPDTSREAPAAILVTSMFELSDIVRRFATAEIP